MNSKVTQKTLMIPVYPNRGITLTHGEGIYLFDETGKKYIDCVGGFGASILGHGNKAVSEAICTQARKLSTMHCSFNNDTRARALTDLEIILPNGLNKVYFANSGTEAVEAALKFAIISTRRSEIIAMKNGYHGKTLGALSLTTSSEGKYRKPFKHLMPKVDLVEFNDINELERIISNKHGALILEPVQGEGGVIPATAEFMKAVRSLCDKHGVIMILDEIQTGMGRTGNMFAFEEYGVIPNILCLGKGVAGGIPAGITIVREDLATAIPKGTQTSTLGGNPLACAGISATISELRRLRAIKNAKDIGKYFLRKLKTLESTKIVTVRGQGLMIGIELSVDPMPYLQKMQRSGILVAPAGNNTMRFLPPLILSKENVNEIMNKLRKAFRSN